MTDSSNASFYKWQADKDGWVCKVCGQYTYAHADDCIVPNARQAMDIVADWLEAKKKTDDRLRKLMQPSALGEL